MTEVKLNKTQEEILSLLSNGFTQAKVSGYMNVSRATVSQVTTLLINHNLLKKQGDGHYNVKYYTTTPHERRTDLDFKYTPHEKKKFVKKCKICGRNFKTNNKDARFCSSLCKGDGQRGPNSPRYTGSSFFPYCWMYNAPLKERVKAFFNYRCVMCGKDERENFDRKGRQHRLSVHHVKYNQKACCKGHDKPKDKQFVPLCLICHNRTTQTKDRQMWLEYFSNLIEEQHGGKCYFTKEEFAPQDMYYKF